MSVTAPSAAAPATASTAPARSGRTAAGTALAIVLLLVAVVIFIVLDPVLAWDDDNPYVGRGRLFLYFTSQSNMIAVAALVVSAVALLRGRETARWVDHLRGLAVVDMAITGIVNGALLAEPGAGFDFSEFVLHQGGPLVIAAWWIAVPPARPLSFGAIGLWLLHPVIWTAATLMYAAESSDNWVPYFFLDASEVDGAAGVAMYVAVILAVVAILGALAVLASRLLPWRARANHALLR